VHESALHGGYVTRILMVEDNLAYSEEVAGYLVEQGHTVTVVGDAAGLWKAVASSSFDIVLLDLGLPDEDGVVVIAQLRKAQPDVGLVVLTARVRLETRLQALDLGADHYLTKPTKLAEIQSVIGTLSRRMSQSGAGGTQSPQWLLHVGVQELQHSESPKIKLTEHEFAFLMVLSRTSNAMTRDAILQEIGEADDVNAHRKLDMVAYRLRKKVLNQSHEKLPLTSKYGQGYRLTVPFGIQLNGT
jgi:DNA-binding response OmpR family regulator